jgi:threonine dehydrogenase-like Zn-dependent dehydrogenase
LVKPGDPVIATFAFSDGTCGFCQKGLQTSCLHGGYWGGYQDGGQAEAVRVPLADGTLVPFPAPSFPIAGRLPGDGHPPGDQGDG